MQIKQIIFDFGGVLIDWDPRYVYRQVFSTEEQVDYFLENICTHDWNEQQDAGRTLKEATELLVDQHPEHEEHIRMYYDRWTEMIGGAITENVEVLEQLAGSYPIYGLTNWSNETFPWAYKNFDFFQLMEGIVVSGDEKLKKPDRRIYETLLNRYGLEAPDSLFIDDNPRNIAAASEIGFKTIHLSPGTDLAKEINKLGLI